VGHVAVEVTISNPTDPDLTTTATALVDTGASFTVVPRAIATALDLPKTGRMSVRTANGNVELDRSRAYIHIGQAGDVSPVLVSDTLDKVLLGVITLETLALTVNPTTGELNEMEILFY
jgi:clan AA aspartic protease